jgi:cleavage stimulation factor subunit 3
VALPRLRPFARFVGKLTTTFRAGPVFRTDDLMQVFRGAVIPSVTGRSRSPPPPPRSGEQLVSFFVGSWCRLKANIDVTQAGGRPPPDYGPYQGPGGGRRRY